MASRLLNHVQTTLRTSPQGGGPLRKKQKMTKLTGRWNPDEHDAYVRAVQKYGRDWTKVAREVKTRTPQQVRTHDQKIRDKHKRTSSCTGLFDVYAANIMCAMRTRSRLVDPLLIFAPFIGHTVHVTVDTAHPPFTSKLLRVTMDDATFISPSGAVVRMPMCMICDIALHTP